VEVRLTAKAFELLVLLVSERPRAVRKAELLERVWPGTFVTDASLARTVHEIRAAIGENPPGSTIRTMHGFGYSFVAETHDEGSVAPVNASTVAQPPTRAWLVDGSRAIPLTEGVHVVGRDPAAAIPVKCHQTSWHHARLQVTSAGVTIEDLASKNGTMVSGKRVTSATPLIDADELTFGSTRFTLKLGEKPPETATSH
jgi:DNA-binding winged helix-turn-helix (wHTH) protein